MKDNPDRIAGQAHGGHRLRLKKRYRGEGLDGFEAHNILELLLFFGVPMKDTNIIAHRLIERFGSLAGIFDASYAALAEVDGIGENAATLIKLLPDVAKKISLERLDRRYLGSELAQAGHYLVGCFFGDEIESAMLLVYDSADRLKCRVPLSSGENAMVNVSPRRISELLIERKAASFILAHNHTNGIVEPSQEDLTLTRNLAQTFSTIGIPMRAHYIVAYDRYLNIML